MSPWGKFYLENFAYRPGWWEPFESWRMFCGVLNHMIDTYGPIDSFRWMKVSRHLDKLEIELRHSDFRG
jgi:hypothetical protein